MKWVDYRKKLGIGFSDSSKAKMLSSKVATFIGNGSLNENYSPDDYYRFCLMVGTVCETAYFGTEHLKTFFSSDGLTISQIISYYIAFVNTQTECDQEHLRALIDVLCEFLEDLSIQYEVFWDNDGAFIFPKGAPELDAALVSEPLDWMAKYPNAQKAWIKALKDYSEQSDENASDIADKFRKALETFFREFFGGGKSLENYKTEYGDFLKSHGVPAELSGNYQKLLESYTNYINNYAKHQDKTSRNVLEYIMYQSGNIIRLLITLREGETT